VGSLAVFLFFVFGIIGVELWKGAFRNRCSPYDPLLLAADPRMAVYVDENGGNNSSSRGMHAQDVFSSVLLAVGACNPKLYDCVGQPADARQAALLRNQSGGATGNPFAFVLDQQAAARGESSALSFVPNWLDLDPTHVEADGSGFQRLCSRPSDPGHTCSWTASTVAGAPALPTVCTQGPRSPNRDFSNFDSIWYVCFSTVHVPDRTETARASAGATCGP
jgi:hypothetical protein